MENLILGFIAGYLLRPYIVMLVLIIKIKL